VVVSKGPIKCSNCGFECSDSRYKRLVERGRKIVRYGIHYRNKYEQQISKHGRIVKKYSLSEPTVVEAVIGIIVSGILGNAAYDAVKSCLRRIYSGLKNRRLKSKSVLSENAFACSEDVDLIFRLIGSDSQFAEHFFRYAREYDENVSACDAQVAIAICEERTMHECASIFRLDPHKFVYVSRSGTIFHRKSCKKLRSPSRRIRLKKAMLSGLKPCKQCDPIA
jgi:hypothetical protein